MRYPLVVLFSRSLVALALLGAILAPVTTRCALAQATTAPTASPSDDARPDKAHALVISGTVVAVDYVKSILTVQPLKGAKRDVLVPPTTSFQGKSNSYHSLVDVKPGAKVEIMSSVAGDRATAQIIKLQ